MYHAARQRKAIGLSGLLALGRCVLPSCMKWGRLVIYEIYVQTFYLLMCSIERSNKVLLSNTVSF